MHIKITEITRFIPQLFEKFVKLRRWLGYSAKIRTLNCHSTNFQEKSWNEGVSFVETLNQSNKGFFMFGMQFGSLINLQIS